MKISIVIPIYNASLLLERCLHSVFNQNKDYDLEVICIDDGSTDNSVEIIKNYPNLIKLLQQSNQGPAAARNKGIEVATGKYLAFLDADDFWEPDFLKETVSFLEKHIEVIAVSVGQKHITAGNRKNIVPGFLASGESSFLKPLILKNFYSFWAEHFHICTGSILIKTEIVKKTKGQRTDLRITEDLEFWAYLATYGYIGFIPKVLFVSDGGLVTKQQGWLKKNKRRWASAPSIKKWEERIAPVIPENDLESYQKVKGRVAKNLSYSMIMSGRSSQAKKMIKEYGMSFPNDRVSSLLRAGICNIAFWYVVILLIKIREFTRLV